jgi:cytochrome P450
MRDESERKADDDGAGVFNRQMVSPAHDHLVFGYGQHTCPGR